MSYLTPETMDEYAQSWEHREQATLDTDAEGDGCGETFVFILITEGEFVVEPVTMF